MNRCLVLPAFCNYPDEAAHPYCNSLSDTGYEGESRIIKWNQSGQKWPIGITRLFLFRDELNKWKDLDTVLITDMRDVIFQSDPSKIEHSDLDCFMEDEGWTIGDEPYNAGWIKAFYGQEELDKLKGKPIHCSGVMIGTKAGILRYIDAIIEEVERQEIMVVGAHQGVHNYLIHNELLECRQVPNEKADVYTVGLLDDLG